MAANSALAGTGAIERSLSLMLAITRDRGERSLAAHATELAIPYSTAHRMAKQLESMGLLAAASHGHYTTGLGLLEAVRNLTRTDILVQVARPLLRRLSRKLRATVHLGVWDGDMVTYLIKETTGRDDLFTIEGGQLEAYCSAIGKVLLASLDPKRQQDYLGGESFVPLTPYTIVDPVLLAEMLTLVHANGYALDQREVAENLQCVAVPIACDGDVIAAISLSRIDPDEGPKVPPPELLHCAEMISARLSGSGPANEGKR